MMPLPLVSCIMPTSDRPEFVLEAVASFLAQDYANLELIIIDDGDCPVRDLVSNAPGIRYFNDGRKRSVAAKRNLACDMAGGDFIVHCDDDDLYAPQRVRQQIAMMIDEDADVAGLCRVHVDDRTRGEAFIFAAALIGGTISYRRDVWRRFHFVDCRSTPEDTLFLMEAVHAGVSIAAIDDPSLGLLRIHGRNMWQRTSDDVAARDAAIAAGIITPIDYRAVGQLFRRGDIVVKSERKEKSP